MFRKMNPSNVAIYQYTNLCIYIKRKAIEETEMK